MKQTLNQSAVQFNILTTEPNDTIDEFHRRMPVWIDKANVSAFLQDQPLDALYDFLVPYTGDMVLYECDPYVNYGKHEGPQCMAKLRSWEQFQKDTFSQ